MQRTITTLALVATLASLTGCANMTPEQRQAAAAAFGAGLAGAAAYSAAQPRYYVAPAPVYIPPPTRTICRRSFGALVCDSY